MASASTLAARTLAEKLIGRATGRNVTAGEIVICRPDFAMGTDGSVPMAIDYLAQMQGSTPCPVDPGQLVFALDHYGLRSGPNALRLQEQARRFARDHGIALFDVGDGIGHQLMIEEGHVAPGRLVVGADSHATSYGALNAFGTGIGSSDLAGIMMTGHLWLEVPATLRVVLRGRLRPRVSAKDIALELARRLGADGATYRALEFAGEGIATLDMDDRIVLANMAVELGAKAGLFPHDAVLADWLRARDAPAGQPVHADPDAPCIAEVTLDLDALGPQVALPHRVDNVRAVARLEERVPVDMVYLGTCTGGRVRDYEEALEVLSAAGRIAPGVEVVVTPASRRIGAELHRRGMLQAFRDLGARIETPGCGACCGTCGSVQADRTVVSSANRNFRGRMGERSARIYLASSYTCAAAAVHGYITAATEVAHG